MEPHGVFKEVTTQCTNKDHYQSVSQSVGRPGAPREQAVLFLFVEPRPTLFARAETSRTVCRTRPIVRQTARRGGDSIFQAHNVVPNSLQEHATIRALPQPHLARSQAANTRQSTALDLAKSLREGNVVRLRASWATLPMAGALPTAGCASKGHQCPVLGGNPHLSLG